LINKIFQKLNWSIFMLPLGKVVFPKKIIKRFLLLKMWEKISVKKMGVDTVTQIMHKSCQNNIFLILLFNKYRNIISPSWDPIIVCSLFKMNHHLFCYVCDSWISVSTF
jgi:hypothetical protein